MAAHVRLSDVSKRYQDVMALHHLDLEVEAGEVLTILGPSGSGKTTTLMLLAGIIQPTSGRIEIGGNDVTALPPYRRDIGVVFQSYALFPHLSVFDNVAFPLRRRGVPRRQIAAEVEQALALVHLERLGGRHIKQLSGGQQQRVALARALVFRPALLLMDEPLGALDKQLREQMQIEIRHITQAVGITAIYVTHDQEEALTLSDRIAVLRAGRLEQVGTPETLYDAPATRFVAEFVGHTNLLEGEVVGEEGGAPQMRTAEGLELRLARHAPVSRGRVVVSMRPERIRLMRAADVVTGAEPFGGRAMGKVTDRIFAGGIVKYRVDVNGRPILVCMANPGVEVREGDQVVLFWTADDAHVVREESA
jgi:putative spermidine/putrescine transport system ATP-binding protein